MICICVYFSFFGKLFKYQIRNFQFILYLFIFFSKMQSQISIPLLLITIIFWLTQIPTNESNKKIVTFYGRITPCEQQFIKKKEEIATVKSSVPMLGRMLSRNKSTIKYEDKRETVPIIWTVEIVECVGCDTKYGPKQPSFITQNGAFYISLLSKSDDGSGIEKLVIKIKSAEQIPMPKNDKEDADMHREFTWILRNPNFDIIHHFQFGHFRRSVQNDEGIYLNMEFIKSLPMFKSDISTLENPKEFIKYLIRVERKKSKSKLWQKIFERKLDESEIQAGKPFKLELVKKSELESKLEPRLLKPRPMKIIIEQKPVCGICGKETKGGSTTIRKLSNCNDYVHESCINEHNAVKNLKKSNGEASTSGGGSEYKCPICNEKMEVKKDGNKEKNKAIFDNNSQIKLKAFAEFHLEMPILQNGDQPEFIYKFDYENKNVGKENYYNAFGMEERKENSRLIEELISSFKSDWSQSTVVESIHRGVNVPRPSTPNVDSPTGASSSQPKNLKMKEKIEPNQEKPPPPPSVPKSITIKENPPAYVPITVIDQKMKGKIDPNPPPPSLSKKHSTKGIKVETSASPMDADFVNLVNYLFNLASKEISREEKLVEIENYYDDWDESQSDKIENLSLDKLAARLSQIKNFAEASDMWANIREMVALGWLRKQYPSEQKIQPMLNRIRQFDSERMKQLLEYGLKKRRANAFKEFVKEYVGMKKEDRWIAMEKWAKFMSLNDLLDQIAVSTKDFEGEMSKWLHSFYEKMNENDSQVQAKVNGFHMDLKRDLEMALILKIMRKSRYESQDRGKFLKKFQESDCTELDDFEQIKLKEKIQYACFNPKNREKYFNNIGVNAEVKKFFDECAKKMS